MAEILSDEEFAALQPTTPARIDEEDVYQEGGGHDPDAVKCITPVEEDA